MSITISNLTRGVLENFLTINKSIHIKPGNKITTLSVNKNIMAEFIAEETFERDVPIYDLSDLTSAFKFSSLVGANPELDLTNDNCLVVVNKTGKTKTRIYYSDPDLIVSAPDQGFKLPEPDISFQLTAGILKQLQMAAASYGVPDLCVYGVDGVTNICVTDKKNETSNTFSIELGETAVNDFCYCFKQENIKVYRAGDDLTYDVSIHGGKVALFECKKLGLKYWIALEPNLSK